MENLAPAPRHVLDQYASNAVEVDHRRVKVRPRPMRGLKTISSLRTIAARHAFVKNLRRGPYHLTADVPVHDQLRAAFAELADNL
jgi:transposase-like protein